MKTNLTIMFIFFLFSCGEDSVTNPPSIEYIAEHQLFMENLLELNPELNPDTLETRIKKEIVVSDGTEYYQISKISLIVPSNDMLIDGVGVVDGETNTTKVITFETKSCDEDTDKIIEIIKIKSKTR